MTKRTVTTTGDSLTAGEIQAMLDAPNGNPRLLIILAWYRAHRLTADGLNAMLQYVWATGGMRPGAIPSADDRAGLVEMFQYAGFVTNNAGIPRPEAPLRLYRGCTEATLFGMSWTSNWNFAAYFADKVAIERKPGVLIELDIDPGHILGTIDLAMGLDDVDVTEYIVNPLTLGQATADPRITKASHPAVRHGAHEMRELMDVQAQESIQRKVRSMLTSAWVAEQAVVHGVASRR